MDYTLVDLTAKKKLGGGFRKRALLSQTARCHFKLSLISWLQEQDAA